ncbi:uncharacterized protein LOC131857637 [Cryptomeria japonica]|uniref:uncharacterized protein LOC131857637 n=1 Tax=Cryptomeria japonica TaxID=3369 RepID=UPI0027DA434D|nr:uncharacterized protein LOC131857637 [Cryptomeria japonica]
MKPQTSTANITYDGIFVQSSTSLANETKEATILEWLFKEENEDREVQHCEVSPEQYGQGYKIIQRMGYLGTCPLGKHQQGIIKPIKLQTKSMNDKNGLGYHLYASSNQKQNSYQQLKWRKKTLHQASQEVNREKTQAEYQKEQEELAIKREEEDYNKVPKVLAGTRQEV